MTNEEKALELYPICIIYSDIAQEKYDCNEAERLAALEMAEWKDWQFKEYLEKKKAERPLSYRSDWKGYENGIYHDFIDEMLDELFPEKN